MSRPGYRPEIDGLRALAVLSVMVYHAGARFLPGGFVGVDIFFVISGYLITTIIAAELRAGRFSLLAFYERRVRRIQPALVAVVLATLPFAWLWLLPADLSRAAGSLLSVCVFVSNLFFLQQGSYFDIGADNQPLLHTWSLAIEEQYYLLFPLLMLVLARWRPAWTPAALGALALLSLGLAQLTARRDPDAAFYLLSTRAWELLLGALAAVLPWAQRCQAAPRAWRQAGAALGLGLLALAFLRMHSRLPHPGVYTLLPTMGAVLLILLARPDTWAGRLLGSRPLVAVGLVSYSAYLWHQPVLALWRYRSDQDLSPPSAALALGLCLVLATLTWRFVERPFRSSAAVSRRQVFLLAALATGALASLALATRAAGGFPKRLQPTPPAAAMAMPMRGNGWCFYSVDTERDLPVGDAGLSCWLGQRTAGTRALLLGDSFAGQYEPLWHELGQQLGWAVHAVTTNWCYPTATDEFTGPAASRAVAQCAVNRAFARQRLAGYDVLILAANWRSVLAQHKLQGVLDLVDQAARQHRLVVVMPTPKQFDANVMHRLGLAALHGQAFDLAAVRSDSDALAQQADQALRVHCRQLRNVLFIDRSSLFTARGQPADLGDEGWPFSWDGRHLSVLGSQAAARNLARSPDFTRLAPLAGH